MNAYYREKLNRAIAWFAKKHFEKTGKYPTQIQLFKYLAFLEFQSVKERGYPVFGLKYKAMKFGPVPEELYNEFKTSSSASKFYQVKRVNLKTHQGIKKVVLILPSSEEPDMKLFSPWELSTMERLVEIYGEAWIGADVFSEASHQKIKAWQKAYQRKPNSLMKFEDELEDLPLKEKELFLERLATFKELTV